MAKRLLKNEPVHFIPDNKAMAMAIKIQAVIVARYFHISPREVLGWPYQELKEFLGIIETLTEVEVEEHKNKQ
ncbi:MAG: hypothetical protein H0Z33_16685 [Bacillaceae bacterium]|nr:hypothetical protein [Bacillaceae bacterium]